MNMNDLLEEVKKEIFKDVELLILACRENIDIPKYAYDGDACMDIRAGMDVTINPSQTKIIPSGIKMIIPKGYELHIKARSGLSLNTPLRISNSIGTIDSGYRDEVGILFTNISNESTIDNIYTLNEKGNKHGTYEIKKGDRIAQISLHKSTNTKIVEIDVETFNTYDTTRGGGFGHSGIN